MSDHLHTLLTAELPHNTFAVDLCTTGQRNGGEFVYTPIADEGICERFLSNQHQIPADVSGRPSSIDSSANVAQLSSQSRSMFSLIVIDDVDDCLAAEPYEGILGPQTQRRRTLRRLRDVRWNQYMEILRHLGIVHRADPTGFNIFPRRVCPSSSATSLFQANNYRLAFDTSKIDSRFELVWSCSQSGAISAVLLHSSTKLTCIKVESWMREMVKHQSLLTYPMTMAIVACFELLPALSSDDWDELGKIEAELPKYFNTSSPEAMNARSVGQLLGSVSRDTSSITNRRSQLVSRKAVVDIVLTECGEITRCQSSSMSDQEWRGASEYVQNHARHQSRDIAQAISDVEIWQQRANNLVQNLCNLIAQHDAQENLIVARDMKLQAEESKKVTEQSKKIAEATMRDSASMRAIAAVTMIYLPGSFLSSLFSTGFFRWNAAPGEALVDPRIRFFWAFTIPITFLTVLLWYVWDRFVNVRAARRASGHVEQTKTEGPAA